MYFLLNLSNHVKSYGHLCQILAFFMMHALQIWPCHVTQEANFEKILFFPISAFNIGKSCKIFSRKALYFRSYQPKTSRGVENAPPPIAYRVNVSISSKREHPSGQTPAEFFEVVKSPAPGQNFPAKA